MIRIENKESKELVEMKCVFNLKFIIFNFEPEAHQPLTE